MGTVIEALGIHRIAAVVASLLFSFACFIVREGRGISYTHVFSFAYIIVPLTSIFIFRSTGGCGSASNPRERFECEVLSSY
jgi:hypothetical protein